MSPTSSPSRLPFVVPLLVVALTFASSIVGVPVHAQPVSACPSGGIEIPLSDDTQDVLAKLAAPGGGRVFCWAPGIHEIHAPMHLHPGDWFVGLTDATTGQRSIIEGSQPIEGWQPASPGVWFASVPGLHVPPLNLPPGLRCLDGTDRCAYPDDVTSGGRRIDRVWSVAEVTAGSYFVDYADDKIYVGVDPSAAEVARSVPLPVSEGRSTPFIYAQGGGGVRDLVVREVGVGMQGAAISCNRCTVDAVDVSLAHGRGITVDDVSTVTSSRVNDNGQGGISIGSRRAGDESSPGVVADNIVSRNGWIRCLGICAGIKASTVEGLTIERNVVRGTFGTGIWIDNDSIGYVVAHNEVVRSRTAGIETEISYDGVIDGNVVVGTGLRPLREIREGFSVGAIHVLAAGSCSVGCPSSATGGISITGNTIGTVELPNAFGVVLRQTERGVGRYGPHLVRNVSVDDNSVVLLNSWHGAVDPTESTTIYESGNTFSGNTYTVPAADAALFRWRSASGAANARLTFAQWQEQGNDVDGSIVVVPASGSST